VVGAMERSETADWRMVFTVLFQVNWVVSVG
jgi:hypothetical protein